MRALRLVNFFFQSFYWNPQLKLSRVMRALRRYVFIVQFPIWTCWNCPELWGHCDYPPQPDNLFNLDKVETVPSYEGIATSHSWAEICHRLWQVETVPSYEGIATVQGSPKNSFKELKLSRVMRALRRDLSPSQGQLIPEGWNCPELWGHCDKLINVTFFLIFLSCWNCPELWGHCDAEPL